MLRLKSTLVPPPGVFLGRVYKSLELYWTKQHADYWNQQKHKHLFEQIFISQKNLRLCSKKQIEQLNQPEHLLLCTGTSRLPMGLPCAHNIWQCLRENEHILIRLNKLHKHWHISREPTHSQGSGFGSSSIRSTPRSTRKRKTEECIEQASITIWYGNI